MEETLEKYGKLLRKVDRWFAGCVERHPTAINCRTGCSECCRGLFDITLLDAFYLKSGFDMLDQETKSSILVRARESLFGLQRLWPDLDEPYILNYRPEEEWEILMPEDDETPCPLLGKDGKCLVYDHRPMTCRLYGLPLVDRSGEVFHDELCTLNFIGTDPLKMPDLVWEFNALFDDELLLFREFTLKLLSQSLSEMDMFIATALLIDFRKFPWKDWLERSGLGAKALR